MKKEQELIQALSKLKREAGIQDIYIEAISLPSRWFVDTEDSLKCPDRLLGIRITNSPLNVNEENEPPKGR